MLKKGVITHQRHAMLFDTIPICAYEKEQRWMMLCVLTTCSFFRRVFSHSHVPLDFEEILFFPTSFHYF